MAESVMTTRLRNADPQGKPCQAWALVWRTILLCLLVACCTRSNAQSAPSEMPALPENVSVLEDPSATLTASQVFARLAHGRQGFSPAT